MKGKSKMEEFNNAQENATEDKREEIKQKLRQYYDGRIVRKDLTKSIREGANVPVYVLEYLLGQYCKESTLHAWNIVNIDGEPYQLDVTWDIGATCQRKNTIDYTYFNLTDVMMARDHKADCKLPECKATKANYYVRNK